MNPSEFNNNNIGKYSPVPKISSIKVSSKKTPVGYSPNFNSGAIPKKK